MLSSVTNTGFAHFLKYRAIPSPAAARRHFRGRWALFIAILFLSADTHAQGSWQWGRRGGSPTDQLGFSPADDVEDITTDKWGNVYVVAGMCAFDMSIGSLPVTVPLSNIHVPDICVASYKCDGTLRWFKMIVASQDNQGFAVKTDTLGGVYVIGRMFVTLGMSPNRGYIMNNTTTDTTMLPFPGAQSMFLLKLDTGGAYKWFRMPEPDTLGPTGPISGFLDMDVDESGNIYTLCKLKPGAYANYAFVAKDTAGWDIWNTDGEYILQYDRNGNFQRGFHLPIRFVGADGIVTYIKRDFKRHRTYISGGCTGYSYADTIFVGGVTVTTMFVACFDDAGNMLWVKHDNPYTGFANPTNRPALDGNGNIYITGNCTDSFEFNGSAPIINELGGSETSFLIKLDTNGNNSWVTSSSNNDVSNGVGVAVLHGTVAVFGYESCTSFLWGDDTIGGTYMRPYLARFNLNTGAIMAIDTLDHDPGSLFMPGEGGGFETSTGTLTVDSFGNFYCGGSFSSVAYIADDTLESVGGYSDWFVAKFGTTNCSVPVEPLQAGNDNVPKIVKIYPNPVTDELIIENAATGSSVRLFDIMGRMVYAGVISGPKQIISTRDEAPGSYILQLTGADGSTNQVIEKQ